MTAEKLNEVLDAVSGLKFCEWKSIEEAVNREFNAMSNRLELTDVSRIKKLVSNEQAQPTVPPILFPED